MNRRHIAITALIIMLISNINCGGKRPGTPDPDESNPNTQQQPNTNTRGPNTGTTNTGSSNSGQTPPPPPQRTEAEREAAVAAQRANELRLAGENPTEDKYVDAADNFEAQVDSVVSTWTDPKYDQIKQDTKALMDVIDNEKSARAKWQIPGLWNFMNPIVIEVTRLLLDKTLTKDERKHLLSVSHYAQMVDKNYAGVWSESQTKIHLGDRVVKNLDKIKTKINDLLLLTDVNRDDIVDLDNLSIYIEFNNISSKAGGNFMRHTVNKISELLLGIHNKIKNVLKDTRPKLNIDNSVLLQDIIQSVDEALAEIARLGY